MTTSQQDTAEKAAQLLAQIAETRSRQAFSELFS
ncbi:MAG TPA: RNA polymerase subunit sigma, partial [Idiomarina baltica]|nr:RNA polymerase subunit sigma [Idiomarina baltica]